MIGSISRVWRQTGAGDTAALPENEGRGLTRASFLKVMTAGFLTTGIGSGRVFAASAGGIAPVTDLDKFYDAWQERFNAWDVEALVDMYVSDVTYINPDGQKLTGKAGVRADFEAVFAMKPEVDLGNRKHIVYRDIVLTTNHWKLRLTDADGVVQNLTGGGIEVIRKEADGGWRFIIDDASRMAV